MANVRIGIQTGQDGQEWSGLLDFWRFLDSETAFDSVWTIDHYVPPGPGRSLRGVSRWRILVSSAQSQLARGTGRSIA